MRDDTEQMPDEQNRYIVPGLRRGLAILRLFNRDRTVVSVPEIVHELGISRATLYQKLSVLASNGRTEH